jgi:hypothetical protein
LTIQRKNPHGALSPSVLARFEERLAPLRLLPDHRDFLLEFNGAELEDSAEFTEVPGGAAVEEVFGLHQGPDEFRLDRSLPTFRDLVPASFLVIATDRYGNYFAIALSGPDRGSVYFVDHERPATSRSDLFKVADSFSQLLQRAGADLAEAD